MENHENTVTNIMDRLIELGQSKPLLPVMAPPMGLETTHVPTIADPIRNQAKRLVGIEVELKSMRETLTQPVVDQIQTAVC